MNAQASAGTEPRSIGNGVRLGVGVATIGIEPDQGATSVGAGPSFAVAYGINHHVAFYSSLDVAYGIEMAGQRSGLGRIDLGVRYTHANRTRRTLPFAEVALSETRFAHEPRATLDDTQRTWRVGLEHFFTPGRSIEVALSPGSSKLDCEPFDCDTLTPTHGSRVLV